MNTCIFTGEIIKDVEYHYTNSDARLQGILPARATFDLQLDSKKEKITVWVEDKEQIIKLKKHNMLNRLIYVEGSMMFVSEFKTKDFQFEHTKITTTISVIKPIIQAKKIEIPKEEIIELTEIVR